MPFRGAAATGAIDHDSRRRQARLRYSLAVTVTSTLGILGITVLLEGAQLGTLNPAEGDPTAGQMIAMIAILSLPASAFFFGVQHLLFNLFGHRTAWAGAVAAGAAAAFPLAAVALMMGLILNVMDAPTFATIIGEIGIEAVLDILWPALMGAAWVRILPRDVFIRDNWGR